MSDVHPALFLSLLAELSLVLEHLPLVNHLLLSHAWRGGCQAALLAQQSHLLQAALRTWVLNWEASVGHRPGATSQAGSCVPAQLLPPLSNGFEQHLQPGCKGHTAAQPLYPCSHAKGLIHSPAEPWHSSGPETQLLPNSMNQAPECLNSHHHSGYLRFHLLPLLLLPSSSPAPLHLHFLVQNEYAKFPCTFVKHSDVECTERKDNGFSFLC